MPETPGIGQPIRESFRVLGVYVRGQVLLCLILAVLYGAAFFWPVHVPYWWRLVLWADVRQWFRGLARWCLLGWRCWRLI